MVCLNLYREKFNSSSCPSVILTYHKLSDKFIYIICTLLSVVSAGASSRDGQAAQDTTYQQLQQGDTVETFRQNYLSSCKFKFNVIHSLDRVWKLHEFTINYAITGSALALHCCKAHAKINRKMGNSTPCKIVSHKNFNLKLCTRDFVGESTHHANFGSNRCSGGFSPYRRNITTL